MHLPSRLRLPPDVTSRLGLERGERPLAWAKSADGRWYVGSDRALHIPTGDGYRRLPWEHVARADWQGDHERLVIVESADWGRPEPRIVVEIADPGRLLDLLRERVTRSVLYTRYIPVGRGTGLNIVGRRSPSTAGPVQWSFVLAAGLDPDDPEVVEAADLALRQAQAEVEGF